MKILLTGEPGYLAHRLALQATDIGYAVHALVANTQAVYLPRHASICFFKGDVTLSRAVAKAMAGCSYVIHTAALNAPAVTNQRVPYRTQVGCFRNVLEAAIREGLKRIDFSSTCLHNPSPNGSSLNEAGGNSRQLINADSTQHCAGELVKELVAPVLPGARVSPDTPVSCQHTSS